MMGQPSDKIKSTPERKREYIQHWLEENLLSRRLDSDEETPSTLHEFREECNANSAILDSPKRNSKVLSSCMSQVSPVLGGKRLASSPVIGGNRRIAKRIKLIEKFSTTSEINKIKFPVLIPTRAENTTNTQAKCNADNIETPEHCDKFNNCFTSESSVISIETNDNDRNIPKPFEHPVSQLIESISSQDESHENSEVVVQEILSTTDKTESDLIEDISTQLMIEPNCCASPVPLSQNISNPSSGSLDGTNCFDTKKTNITKVNQQLQETCTSTDPIDTVSTLESKVDFGKISYILHYAEEKEKRKKNPKKGSLLEALVTAMAKERSTVNLLRHQLHKQPNIVADKPHVLFQIVEYLPVINGNQIFKCALIEDSTGLLNDLLKDKNDRLITVMNVPEISCLVNTSQKPILKIYEPLIILDPNQLFLQISRFVAVPSNDSENLNYTDKSLLNKDLKVVRKFSCPCLDEKVLSSKCASKFTGASNEGVKMLFDHN